MSNKKPNVWKRRKARRALVQAVYEWQLSGNSFTTIRDSFNSGDALKKADREYFEELLRIVLSGADSLDETYVESLDRPIEQLDQVERVILRLAAAELRDRIDVPYRVVIDEYVELAKTFGAQDSHKYINGVIDKMAAQLRQIEVSHNVRSNQSADSADPGAAEDAETKPTENKL